MYPGQVCSLILFLVCFRLLPFHPYCANSLHSPTHAHRTPCVHTTPHCTTPHSFLTSTPPITRVHITPHHTLTPHLTTHPATLVHTTPHTHVQTGLPQTGEHGPVLLHQGMQMCMLAGWSLTLHTTHSFQCHLML